MALMLREAREHLHQKLIEQGFDNPSNTTLVLFSHILNRPKSYVLAHGSYELTPQEKSFLHEVITKISKEVPLPYILGEWEFFGRKFIVSPDVMIPRPETELLVEKALQIAKTFENPRIIDVGTGSGAIIISLASELPPGIFIASDLSRGALKIAKHNTQRFSLSQIQFLQADLLTSIYAQFDLICANLPYIPRIKMSELQVAKSEPLLALDGGIDGLVLIQKLITQAQSRLTPKGAILLEIEASLGNETLSIAKNTFPQAACKIYQDLAGHDRLLEIRSP
jgi:release factor glutamine methyltransferase